MKHVQRRRLAGAGTMVVAAVAATVGLAVAGSAAEGAEVTAQGAAAARSAPMQEVPFPGRAPSAVSGQKAFYSSNWSGYGKSGSYHTVSGTWNVPVASMHADADGFSSNWVGIGACGSPCARNGKADGTLIQAGTEQDATATGGKLYRAWYELLPHVQVPVKLAVGPGDTMNASISETAPGSNHWKIVIRNVTRSTSVTVNKTYVSHNRSVEWVEEATLIGYPGGASFTSLPNLSRTTFSHLTANGAGANISSGSIKFTMVTVSGNTLLPRATPSAPKNGGTSFAVCTYQPSCS